MPERLDTSGIAIPDDGAALAGAAPTAPAIATTAANETSFFFILMYLLLGHASPYPEVSIQL
jgi:hypothetical protein